MYLKLEVISQIIIVIHQLTQFLDRKQKHVYTYFVYSH